MTEANLARFLDRFTMEHVRVFPHPVERVWRAIIQPEAFGVWFIRGRLDPRVGGEFWFGDDGFSGVVEAIEPPRLLRLGGGPNGERFRYELEPVGEGTRMRFVHYYPPGDYAPLHDPGDPNGWTRGGDLPGGPGTPWRPGFVAGFHEMFDGLGLFLNGERSRRGPGSEFKLVKLYRAHIEATIPPPAAGAA